MDFPPAASGILAYMLDTLEVARSLTDAEFTSAQANAITNAVRRAAEHGDHVTSDRFKAGLAEVRAEMRTEFAEVRAEMRTEFAAVRTEMRTEFAAVRTEMRTEFAAVRTEIADVRAEVAGVRTDAADREARLIRWVVGAALAAVAAGVGAVAAMLRFWPPS